LYSNLTGELLEHERIVTTEAKAKEVRSIAERIITLGKVGSLPARRQALAAVHNKKVVDKLFEEIAPKFAGRSGGYTRIIKLGPRPGDAAPMAILELVK